VGIGALPKWPICLRNMQVVEQARTRIDTGFEICGGLLPVPDDIIRLWMAQIVHKLIKLKIQ
jgi:hypothetical protein